MHVEDRQNKITITIDLESHSSVVNALELIRKEANFPMTAEKISTSKIRLIKLVRGWADEVAKSALVNDEPSVYVTHTKRSLKLAKKYVENALENKEVQVI